MRQFSTLYLVLVLFHKALRIHKEQIHNYGQILTVKFNAKLEKSTIYANLAVNYE